ncbi:barstar family protein [Deinococcus multiflagellatus]|uniref:Barstar family protein n=1 Tax=Deinococcus multiflagellatus TaxID=1656887 RepID=A0ABW1ZE95_9DEIO|nr:barstar family protein [Deinococcus multiflagellatus]MBZ9712919.1 barstar family protein [Deinococcus multiflagellatus]
MNTRTKIVDCSGVRSEQDFWAAYVRDVKPESPDSGRNFDAFWDALWGGPGWPDADKLRFIHTSAVATFRDGQFIAMLRETSQGTDSVRLVFE